MKETKHESEAAPGIRSGALLAHHLPKSPLDYLPPRNRIEYINNHAEVIIGDRRALIDIEQIEKVSCLYWSNNPRGPVNSVVISRHPKRTKNVLMAKTIYGTACSFVDGNRYDLRWPNVTEHQIRIGMCCRKSKRLEDCGIYRKDGAWRAQARCRDKILLKSFSVRKYGEIRAKEMAQAARKVMVDLAWDTAKERLRNFKRLPALRFQNEIKNAPVPERATLLNLAKLYAERNGFPQTMVLHLYKMILIGGGRIPKLENRKDLAPVNIYEGNEEYKNSVIEVERDEETGEIQGFQSY